MRTRDATSAEDRSTSWTGSSVPSPRWPLHRGQGASPTTCDGRRAFPSLLPPSVAHTYIHAHTSKGSRMHTVPVGVANLQGRGRQRKGEELSQHHEPTQEILKQKFENSFHIHSEVD